ncbi:platelet glycoprotein VI-like [Macrotis lagotis]|uniref:platelet glycoprotein VI-like n=1 Tax=Macrotis lagotis TaxID=92651 RepID=UPI003D69237C
MVPTLSAQLCLGLCLCWGVWTQVGPWPRPSLWAEPGSVIPWGNPVTLWCEGPPGADRYSLWKEGGYLDVEMSAEGWGARRLISHMAAETAGRYRCLYIKQSFGPRPVRTCVYDPPSLSAVPSSQVTPGQDVTLQCRSLWWYDRSALVKEGEETSYRHAQGTGRGAQTNFSLPAVTPAQAGTYRCHSFDSNSPYVWSEPSDPLVLRVTGNRGRGEVNGPWSHLQEGSTLDWNSALPDSDSPQSVHRIPRKLLHVGEQPRRGPSIPSLAFFLVRPQPRVPFSPPPPPA